MKKLLVLTLSILMTMSFMACGEDTADKAVDEPTLTAEEQAAEEQSLADADYKQMGVFAEAIVGHEENMLADFETGMAEYSAGNMTEEDLLALYEQYNDEAADLVSQLEAAEWNTEHYEAHIQLLYDAISALSQGEQINYEASVQADEALLQESKVYFETYQTKIDEFLTMLGV